MEEKIYVTRSSMPPYEEFIEMIRPLWETARLTNMGPLHKQLEEELKEHLGIPHISLMTNGHMALELALQAENLTGEVITTPFTFVSTTHAIVRNGLKPVFCDINLKNYTIDVDKIEELITEKTSAIVPVHVYGQVCDVEKIEKIAKKHHLKVIYDAAHAFGVKKDGKSILNWGDASVLSFHATKVFNTVEGGAVVYRDEELGRDLYGLKNFGIRNEITIDAVGANAKMDELRAAMGLCNLKYVKENIAKRKKLTEYYRRRLSKCSNIKILDEQEGVESNYAYFPIVINTDTGTTARDLLYDMLKKEGIYSRKYFYPLIADCECYSKKYTESNVKIARFVSEHVLTLPLYADLKEEQVDNICDIVLDIMG